MAHRHGIFRQQDKKWQMLKINCKLSWHKCSRAIKLAYISTTSIYMLSVTDFNPKGTISEVRVHAGAKETSCACFFYSITPFLFAVPILSKESSAQVLTWFGHGNRLSLCAASCNLLTDTNRTDSGPASICLTLSDQATRNVFVAGHTDIDQCVWINVRIRTVLGKSLDKGVFYCWWHIATDSCTW